MKELNERGKEERVEGERECTCAYNYNNIFYGL